MDLQLAVIRYLSILQLQIIAGSDAYSAFVHGELYGRLCGLLRVYLLDPSQMVRMLDRTHSVIVGSAGLYMVCPSTWWPTSLDVCCPLGRLGVVVRFFNRQGYVVQEHQSTDGAEGQGQRTEDGSVCQWVESRTGQGVVNAVVVMKKSGTGWAVNVMESAMPCAEAPLFASHSTLVMNAVTSAGVICFYPEYTLLGRGEGETTAYVDCYSLKLSAVTHFAGGYVDWVRDGDVERAALEKYRRRGYTTYITCKEVHGGHSKECSICTLDFRAWHEGVAWFSYRAGEGLRPSGAAFVWRLGGDATSDRGWRDRGALVLAEGDEESQGVLYDGLTRQTVRVSEETMEDWM